MNIITKIIFWLCVTVVAFIAILAWIFIGWQIGIAGVVATIAFIVAYGLSGKIAISRRDKYTHSEWGIFSKKIIWAWGTALVIYAIAYIIIAYKYGDVIDVMPK